MDKIAFIAPFPDIAALARKICKKNHPDVEVFDGLLEEGLACARKALTAGFRVIISRGGTANLIRKNITAPVVDVQVTGYDILRIFSEFIGTKTAIGVIGYRNVVDGCKAVSHILDLPVQELLSLHKDDHPQWDEIRQSLQQHLDKNPVDVLIGDTLIVSKLQLNVPRIRLILSGEEAVTKAIEEARRIAKIQTEEQKGAEQFRAILNFIHDGVLAVDNTGHVQVFNFSAEKIFKLKAADVIGKTIDQFIPNSRLFDILKKGTAELEQLQYTPSGMIVTNRVPIKVGDEVTGAVETFQEAGKIQKAEQKIRKTLHDKGLYAKYSFADILAWDPKMRHMIEQAKRYAMTDGTVLIQAESGCGKELFAQSIHQASGRWRGPFVAINCSALPTHLLESELFGYVEGAFTGARKEGKAGLVESAHGGTLFLDEIGDMELRLQARLLRVLEERQVMRLGSDNWIPVDIRILAATNVPLKKKVQEGQFRMDLFFRLNVLNLAIPPLRQRKKDICPLAGHFLSLFAKKYGCSTIELSAEAKRLMTGYAWPGNVRELRNIMERTVLVYEESRNVPDILEGFLKEDENSSDLSDPDNRVNTKLAPACDVANPVGNIQNLSMKAMKRQFAIGTLKACAGNKTKAAQQLGITRYTLDRLIK